MATGGRVAVGRISGVFGIKGWVKIHSETQPKENLFGYQPLWLAGDESERQIVFDRWQPQGKGLIAHVEGIDDRDLARELVGGELRIERASLPPLPEGEYYWHQLVGLDVYTEVDGSMRMLGRVASLLETGANDVLDVVPCEGSIDGRERLIPWVPDEFVLGVDLDRKRIEVSWDPDF